MHVCETMGVVRMSPEGEKLFLPFTYSNVAQTSQNPKNCSFPPVVLNVRMLGGDGEIPEQVQCWLQVEAPSVYDHFKGGGGGRKMGRTSSSV